MAIQTITYSNKSYINENAGVAATNKVQATDMNEIKTVVNNNATELTTTNTALSKIGEIVSYTLTPASGSLASLGWRSTISTYTTESLEAGTYMFVFYGNYSNNSANGMATVRTVIDGNTNNDKRISVPLYNGLTSSINLPIVKTFSTAGTHTLNLDTFPSTTISVATYFVDIIRLK